MHYPFEYSGSHIKDCLALATKICYSSDSASYHIRTILGSLSIKTIEELVSTGNPEELNAFLVETLNHLLVSPHLYSPAAFDSVGITPVVSMDPDRDATEELVGFNHQLLQATYPEVLEEIFEDPAPPASDTVPIGDRSVHLGTGRDFVVITGDDNKISFGADDTLALSEFEISETAIEDTVATFVSPINYAEITSQMKLRQLVWIVGAPEAGKTTLAMFLAHSERPYQSVYKIKGTRAWSIISKSNIEDSVILLSNAIYLSEPAATGDTEEVESLDEADLDDEETEGVSVEIPAPLEFIKTEDADSDDREDFLHPLQQILDRGNTVIITATQDVFVKAYHTTQIASISANRGFECRLDWNSYGQAERLKLIRNAVNLAHRRELNSESKQWALNACEKLERDQDLSNDHPIFKEWLPGEIISFVTSILASARSQDEVEAALKVSLKKRLHSWFMELDESTRCFVLTRTIFPNLEEHELHEKMGEIVSRLKKTYSLTLSTPGVYSYHAMPYISDSPPYRFINAHVLSAATDVVARFYNQPFRELCPILVRWTVPVELETASLATATISKGERDKLVRDSAPLRTAVARMAGNVGKYDLNNIYAVLESWAGHPLRRIAQAAGIALREALTERNFEQVFGLVEGWARRSGTKHFQKRSAADALWRLISSGLTPVQSLRAIRLLEHLAKDSNPYVRRAVAYAASQVAHAGEVEKVEGLLTLLASDQREDVRTYLALCLATPCAYRSEIGLLVQKWTDLPQPRLFEVAVLYLLMSYGRREEPHIHIALHRQPENVKKAVIVAIKLLLRRRSGAFTLRTFRRLSNELVLADDDLANQLAIFALSELRRRAADFGRGDIQALANGLLRDWEILEDKRARLAVYACFFNNAQSSGERRTLLHDKLGHAVISEDRVGRIEIAKRLVWMAVEDHFAIHQILQDWLVLNDQNAVGVVVFYWLVVNDDLEPERFQNLIEVFDYFPAAFERALAQAFDILSTQQILDVLRTFAFHERAALRKQAVIGLGRMPGKSEDILNELLEDWLSSGHPNAGATVVLFWLTTEQYCEREKYENLKAIQNSFPIIFDHGIREAVRDLGTVCLTPSIAELTQVSHL